MVALPDIATINKLKEYSLNNAALELWNPMTMVDDGVMSVNEIKLEPGVVIPVANNQGGPNGRTLDVLPRNGNFDITMFNLEDLRMQIKKELLDSADAPLDSSVRSAAEVEHRQAKLAEEVGPPFGRVKPFLTSLVNRSLEVMANKGLMPALRLNGKEVSPGFSSPIAAVQETEELNAIAEFTTRVNQLYPGFGAASIRLPEAATYLADKLRIPAHLVPTPEEMEQKMAELAEAQANQSANGDAEQQQQGGSPSV